MLPSHKWRYNSASGLRSRTDFNNRLTHRIQYSPILASGRFLASVVSINSLASIGPKSSNFALPD